MTVRVLALASGETGLEDHRHGLQTFMQPAGVLNSRSGLAPLDGAADLVAVSEMQANVTPFLAWIDGTSSSLQGGYPFTSDADETLTFSDGDPINDRIDLVVARVRDDVYDASGLTEGSVEIVEGTPSSSPSVPAVPDSSTPLWEVRVNAGTSAGSGGINFSANRTDRRQHTSALGGLLPVANATVRDALVGPFPGMSVYREDTDWIEVWNGTYWSIQSPVYAASESGRPSDVADNRNEGVIVMRDDLNALEFWDGNSWEILQDSLHGRTGSSRSDGSSTPAKGTVLFKIQAGTATGAPDSNGEFDFVFPEPFPNGFLSLVITPGNLNQTNRYYGLHGDTSSPTHTSAKARIVVRNGSDGALTTSGTARFDFIAIGW